MASDDEMFMHDGNDDGDDFYSGGDGDDSDDADVDYDFIDNDSDDSDTTFRHRSQSNYSILTEADIHKHQEESIAKISTVLSIPRVAAGILLRHYNWSVSKVNDEWFADEEKVRGIVGLLQKPMPLPDEDELTCGICFEMYPRNEIGASACGHPFCVTCWQGKNWYDIGHEV